jgi:hypothetical protein
MCHLIESQIYPTVFKATWKQALHTDLNSGTCDHNIHLCLFHDSLSSRGSSVGIATTIRAVKSGIRIQARVRDVSLRRNVQTESGAHPASYSISTVVFFHGVMRLGREVNYSPTSGAEVKNAIRPT